jgi:hypothetical protein
MMGIETIIAINGDIARRAAAEGLVPHVPNGPEEVYRWRNLPFEFPNIGSYKPPGWKKMNEWFVDATGCGSEIEPALTHHSFREEAKQYIAANPTHGFAITEEGPFQVYISAFGPAKPCIICKGSGRAISVDSVSFEGGKQTVTNPREEECMCCEG